MGKKTAVAPFVGLLILWGCGVASISQDVREKAWPIAAFSAVREHPDDFKGKTIILGGEIVETRNHEDGSTTIVVMAFPLDDNERPEKWENAQGRFMVRSPDFLDPELYTRGRDVTVAGVVEGVKVEPVGETPYRYVALTALQTRLWPPWYHRFTYPAYPLRYFDWYPDSGTY